MASNPGPSNFFREYMESFMRQVDLDAIVVKLWEKEVLTENEYQTVTLQTSIESKKKQDLCGILHRKPQWVPWIVLDCLLEDGSPHNSHEVLADELGRYLQQWPCGRRQFQEDAGQLSALATLHPRFANVVCKIAEALRIGNVSCDDLVAVLNHICTSDGIPLSLPTVAPDFPSLVVLLRQQGLCHELDADLLCRVLSECSTPEPLHNLHAYFNSIKDVNVLEQVFPDDSVPLHEHFLAFTFHSVPSLTLDQAQGIKDFLVCHLEIPRHAFSLKMARRGSVVLVWQFPFRRFKHFKTAFEDMRSELRSEFYSKTQLLSVTLKPSSGAEVSIVIRKRKRSEDVSSSTDEDGVTITSPIKMKRTAQFKSHSELSPPVECQGEQFCLLLHTPASWLPFLLHTPAT